MAAEIERKFLVNKTKWADVELKEQYNIEQGYLLNTPDKTVRIRVKNDKGFITIKGKTEGISRPEFEYEIPLKDATELLKNFCESTIKKIRHTVLHQGDLWEVDEFFEENKGLLMAELELKDKDQQIDLPGWIEKEVSGDERFYNAYLSKHPFTSWP